MKLKGFKIGNTTYLISEAKIKEFGGIEKAAKHLKERKEARGKGRLIDSIFDVPKFKTEVKGMLEEIESAKAVAEGIEPPKPKPKARKKRVSKPKEN